MVLLDGVGLRCLSFFFFAWVLGGADFCVFLLYLVRCFSICFSFALVELCRFATLVFLLGVVVAAAVCLAFGSCSVS